MMAGFRTNVVFLLSIEAQRIERVHSCASMLNICLESMSTARMSLYSIMEVVIGPFQLGERAKCILLQ